MADLCKGCGKPVIDGDACYAGREPKEHWHWDCHEKVAKQYESTRDEWPAALERATNALERLRHALLRGRK